MKFIKLHDGSAFNIKFIRRFYITVFYHLYIEDDLNEKHLFETHHDLVSAQNALDFWRMRING